MAILSDGYHDPWWVYPVVLGILTAAGFFLWMVNHVEQDDQGDPPKTGKGLNGKNDAARGFCATDSQRWESIADRVPRSFDSGEPS